MSEQQLQALVEQAETTVRVHDLLEEMAPDLLRINPYAAETAARILIRLKAWEPERVS